MTNTQVVGVIVAVCSGMIAAYYVYSAVIAAVAGILGILLAMIAALIAYEVAALAGYGATIGVAKLGGYLAGKIGHKVKAHREMHHSASDAQRSHRAQSTTWEFVGR